MPAAIPPTGPEPDDAPLIDRPARRDWSRLVPDADHRWVMGLGPGQATKFFASRDATGALRAERDRWLSEDPVTYAALPREAEPALRDTLELACSLGGTDDETLPPLKRMLNLGRAWEPDFVWMHPDEEGVHRLIGGVVCFPSSWALQEKLGQTMSEIHAPVPGLNHALARHIETFFTRLEPGDVWTRENLNYSRDTQLNHHPSRPRPRLDATVTLDECFIRLESQLLLKFARSGSILFAIRVEVFPMAELLQQPGLAARVARSLETMSPEVAAYKGVAAARPALMARLRPAPR